MPYKERTGEQGLMAFMGMDVSQSELRIPAGKSPSLINVDLHPIGSMKDRDGFSVLSSTGGSGTSMVIHRSVSDSGIAYYYAQVGSRLMRSNSISGPWEETTAVFSLSRRVCILNSYYNGGSVALMCDGENVPQIATMDSTIADDAVNWPAGSYGDGDPDTGTKGYPSAWTAGRWPRFIAITGVGLGADAERCFAYGFSDDRYRIDYSQMGVTTNFLRKNVDDSTAVAEVEVDGGYFFVGRGDQDDIVGIKSMFGYTVVFKKKRTYILQGDVGSSGFRVTHVFDVGALSRRSIISFGNDVAFWSESGPRLLSTVLEHGDLQEKNIGIEVQRAIDNVSSGRHDEIVCLNDLDNNRLMWFAPTGGSSTNNKVLVFYYDLPRWTLFSGAYAGMSDIISVGHADGASQHVYAIDYARNVVEIGISGTDGDEPIVSEYITHWHNYGAITDAVRSLWIDLLYGDNGDSGLKVEWQADLAGTWHEIEPPMKTLGSDGFRWDDDNAAWDDEGAEWDKSSKAYNKHTLAGVFNIMRLKFTGSGDGRFEVLGYRIEARQKGSRP